MSKMPNDIESFDELDDLVISGQTKCSTSMAKWICINHIYEKIKRENVYNVGCSHTNGVVDHWFSFSVEKVRDVYLMHFFITNNQHRNFQIGMSQNSNILNHKKDILYLSQTLQNFKFCNTENNLLPLYLTTYSFPLVDIESFKNKKLYVHVKFMEIMDKDEETTNISTQVKLHHDFYNLFKDPINSDFIIESEDGHQFHVHQLILANQSEVFYAMLKGHTSEKQTAYVKLVDVAKEDLSDLLEFIYSGTIKDLEKCNCIKVYMLADRYYLVDLMMLLENAICDDITIDNAIEILAESELYNSTFIKNYIMKFIKRHPELLQSESWKTINNVDLLKQLCIYMQE